MLIFLRQFGKHFLRFLLSAYSVVSLRMLIKDCGGRSQVVVKSLQQDDAPGDAADLD